MKRIAIISGASREHSRTLQVAKWVLSRTNDFKDQYELVDLKEENLVHYNEPSSPSSPNSYKYKETMNWSKKIDSFDGFIFVIPEYNGFFPGIVKDAVDYLYREWEGKPFALVGLGGKGGKWACDHLKTLLERFDMKYKGFVGVTKPWESLQEDGSIDESYLTDPIESILKSI